MSEIDPFSASFLEDPYPYFKRLRDEAPVHFVASRKMWMVTRYDDVVAAARNTAAFSSTGGVGYDWNARPMMPMYDPPEHSRMRRMVARHFTPAAVTGFKSKIQGLVDDIVARALEARSVDIVADIALPLSLGTIAELLGVPRELRGELRRWSQGTIEDLAGGLAPKAARRVDELRREFNVYLKSLIEERRVTVEQNQTALDVITALVVAQEDDKLTQPELVAFCVLLLVAGYETTVNAISNGVLALLEHPAELARLRADRSLIPRAIEEMVRYDGPVLSFFRNTLSDVELGGQTIPKGEKVMLAFASGNRDERKFPEPDRFRVDRDTSDHLAYGAGVHYCLGAPLARLQLAPLFDALIDRVATIEPTAPPVRTASVLFRGIKTFPVRLTPAPGVVLPPRESSPSLIIEPPASAATPFATEPFVLRVEDSILEDLRARLSGTRWPSEIDWAGWDYGSSRAFMKELTAHWLEKYDWRAHEARINELPQFRARIGPLEVHYAHVRAPEGRKGLPLLLLHGWPGSFLLYSRLVAELAKEGRDLVIASLPGFPFSSAPTERGMGTLKMADVFATLMKGLGYERYGVVGEDLGAAVASRMGLVHGDHVAGIHLNMPIENPPRDQLGQLTPEERTWLREMAGKRDRDLVHLGVHTRQPQSMAYGLNDSPVGLAGWLIDKFRSWSDCGGDVETRFSKDDLITNVMVYWVTGSIASSLRMYYELRQLPWYLASDERIETPTAVMLCKHEILQPPRRWIERVYNLTRLTNIPAGGHFSAWEEPVAVAKDVSSFFASLEEDGNV